MLLASAFTVANALTLTLAAMNIVTPSLRFVEPGIALSIVYVGADNLMVRGGRDVRAWIASAFGFIHGFGYAAAIRELNLSGRALGWSLLSFNIGLELAQLLVAVAACPGRRRAQELERTSGPAGRICRLDSCHRNWYSLVHSAGVFSWRHGMRRVIFLGVLLTFGGLSYAVSAYQQPPAAAGQQAPRVVEV